MDFPRKNKETCCDWLFTSVSSLSSLQRIHQSLYSKNTLFTMRESITALVLLIVLACNMGSAIDEHHWRVQWYTVDEKTYTFGELLGEENWTAGSFHHDWEYGPVYNMIKNHIGFVATTGIYSRGKTYEFRLYDVDDFAVVYIDGEEIFSSENQEYFQVFIPKGVHNLTIKWQEECCEASIGFSADESLFSESKTTDDFMIYAFITAALVMAGVAMLFGVRMMRKDGEN